MNSKKISFESTIPYQTPDSLDDLCGPTSGIIRVGPHIDPSPEPIYDLDNKHIWYTYSAIIRAGTKEEINELINKQLLLNSWKELNITLRCRKIWENKFTELRGLSNETIPS